MWCLRWLLIAAVLQLLSACASGFSNGLSSLLDEVRNPPSSARQTPLKAGIRYLLVENNQREALMVWVGNEVSPMGPTTIWVSADGVVLRLAQGRLVGISEPTRQWQLISESKLVPPDNDPKAPYFSQTTDEQPGQRMGVIRHVSKTPVKASAQTTAWQPQGLHWEQELDVSTGTRLALHGYHRPEGEIVAGQRCIHTRWCLRWQTWPAHSTP